ncbi:hypothetical protein DRO69_02815 [Candidatus Bathyarchaeota archaeon]|nr:MAG: hypothetical protein DRO69_02815 [Candidatus Bathyarchaeota archaeon]
MRIAWISPSPLLPTGLGKVTNYLTQGLAKRGFRVFIGNPQYAGQPLEINSVIHYPIVESNHIPRFLRAVKPDVVVVYASHWVPPYNRIAEICQKLNLRTLFYVTVEFSSLSVHFIRPLIGVNFIATPSQYGKKVMVEHGIPEDRILVVPHGVDTRIFRPFEARFEGFDDFFIYGMVARNNLRKEFPVVIRAFAQLPDEVKESSLLYLHTSPVEENITLTGSVRGWNINILTAKYGLIGKVLLPSDADKWWGVPEHELAQIYNALDVYCHASSGEGFGLPVLEAMACGKPVIASNNTAIPEIVGDAGILVPCHEEDIETAEGFTVATTKIKPFSDAMAKLYYDENLRRTLSQRALERAKQFTWKRAIDLIEKAIYLALEHPRLGPEILRFSKPILSDTNQGMFSKYIPRGKGLALDIGSGKLCLAKRVLEEKGYNYVSLDVRSSRRVMVVGDARYLPFRDRAFDFVWCNQVLEHIPTEDQLRVVEEARRVGKHGCIIYPSESLDCYWYDPDHKQISCGVKKISEIKEGFYVLRW